VARIGTFAEAVLLAANLGLDADTSVAITGQLKGVLHGASQILGPWIERLAWKGRIEGMADALSGSANSD